GVSSLAIDPQRPETVYVAGGIFGALYKTTDGGASWKEANTGANNDLRTSRLFGLKVDPQDSRTIYALAGNIRSPIFKSTDGGTNFSPANSGLPANAIAEYLVTDPQNPGTLYVWEQEFAGIGPVYETRGA